MKSIIAAAASLALLGPAVTPASGDTIVETALAANGVGGPFEGQFDTLIAALQAADPVIFAALATDRGQKTVFAPTDDAFAKLGLDASNVGTALSMEALSEILLYHVAPGRRMAKSVTTSSRVRTLYGDFLYVDGAQLTDAVGRTANIVVTDIETSNGVIHAIDEVVLPFMP